MIPVSVPTEHTIRTTTDDGVDGATVAQLCRSLNALEDAIKAAAFGKKADYVLAMDALSAGDAFLATLGVRRG